MSAGPADVGALPLDPTFPPEAYERTARLLRFGVVGFLILACLGLFLDLVKNPGESVATLLASKPGDTTGSFSAFVGRLAALDPSTIVLVGIAVMVAVTVGRVVYATVDFYRGGERVLATVSAIVVALLLLGLLVVAPFVR